jgi:hypothetical protein
MSTTDRSTFWATASHVVLGEGAVDGALGNAGALPVPLFGSLLPDGSGTVVEGADGSVGGVDRRGAVVGGVVGRVVGTVAGGAAA